MNLFKTFATSQDLERKGIDICYGKNSRGEDIIITIARAGGSNIAYNKAVEARTKNYRRQIQSETLSPEVAESITREIYADAVILGWSGVDDENDQPLEFTHANVITLLTKLPDLFDDLKDQATKAALFRSSILENDSKN